MIFGNRNEVIHSAPIPKLGESKESALLNCCIFVAIHDILECRHRFVRCFLSEPEDRFLPRVGVRVSFCQCDKSFGCRFNFHLTERENRLVPHFRRRVMFCRFEKNFLRFLVVCLTKPERRLSADFVVFFTEKDFLQEGKRLLRFVVKSDCRHNFLFCPPCTGVVV